MTDVERAMTGECFYRRGDECHNIRPGLRVFECWKVLGFCPVYSCEFARSQADKIRVLQAEVRRLNEKEPGR